MADMRLLPIDLRPGINKDDPSYTARGQWTDGDKVRFYRGRPENIGGTVIAIEDQFLGRCRWIHQWSDLRGVLNSVYGTTCGLYVLTQNVLIDITPADPTVTGTLTDPFSTTAGNSLVTVTSAAHGQLAGDTVYFYTTTQVGGLNLIGGFVVQAPVTANTYLIKAQSLATSTTVGGGTVNYVYFRAPLTNDPFTTTNGSPTINVLSANHEKSPGDRVTFSGATLFNGVLVDGEYTVTTVVDQNNFTITYPTNATGTGSGGGANVTRVYLLSCGSDDATSADAVFSAYGSGAYGAGPYGGGASGDKVRTWSGGNFGEILITAPRDGSVYEWQPTQFPTDAARACVIFDSPTPVTSCFVSSERFVVLIGTVNEAGTYDPMLVRWSDRENYYVWTTTTSNAAGEFSLGDGSYALRGIPSRNQSLVWTDTAVYGMIVSSDPGVIYTLVPIATGCGLAGQNSAVDRNGVAFWYSSNGGFYTYSGGLPRPILNPNQRWFASNLAQGQEDKIYASFIGEKNEVLWFFPNPDSDEIFPSVAPFECARYIAYNYMEDHWNIGTYDRTAMIDRGSYDNPIGTSSGEDNKYIWFMETGASEEGEARDCYVVSAPIDLDGGTNLTYCNRFQQDVKFGSDTGTQLLVTMYGYLWPASTPTTYGPYAVTATTERVDFRLQARQIVFRLESNDAVTLWRTGTNRMQMKVGGNR